MLAGLILVWRVVGKVVYGDLHPGFHPGKIFCAPRFSLTRLKYSICTMGASLVSRA